MCAAPGCAKHHSESGAEQGGGSGPLTGKLLFSSLRRGKEELPSHFRVVAYYVMDRAGRERHPIGVSAAPNAMLPNPRGNAVVYLRDQKLYLRYFDPDKTVAVNTGGRVVARALWFPDGRRLLFAWHPRPDKWTPEGLAVFDSSTSDVHDLAQFDRPIDGLALSPDGRTVVLADHRGLVKMRMEDWGLVFDGALVANIPGYRAKHIVWSPNGRFIAYQVVTSQVVIGHESGTDVRGDVTSLWVYDTKASQAQQLREATAGMDTPAWHPRSDTIAYAVADYRFSRSRLYFADWSGKNWSTREKMVVDGIMKISGWSADGTAFAYTVGAKGASRIYVAAGDGSDPHPISPPNALDFLPKWVG